MSGDVLMGYKGTTVLDSGYFYAPYVPMFKTPVALDPNTFNPQRGILSRYGKKIMAAAGPQEDVFNKPKVKKYRSIDEPWEDE